MKLDSEIVGTVEKPRPAVGAEHENSSPRLD